MVRHMKNDGYIGDTIQKKWGKVGAPHSKKRKRWLRKIRHKKKRHWKRK